MRFISLMVVLVFASTSCNRPFSSEYLNGNGIDSGIITGVKVLWRAPKLKFNGELANGLGGPVQIQPVRSGNRLYVAYDYLAQCYDTDSGKVIWTAKLVPELSGDSTTYLAAENMFLDNNRLIIVREWRIVCIDATTEKKYSHSVHFITGWASTSRALILHDSTHASAQLSLRPELLRNFFNNSFTIDWWMRAVSGEQTIFRFLRADSLTGLTISANPFGQIAVQNFPFNSDSDIAILSNGTVCDGAWHHIAISCDIARTLRIFSDGQLNDTLANAADFFHDLSYCSIGAEKTPGHFTIDEVAFLKRAYISSAEFISDIAVAQRDTLAGILALFHFEEFGRLAHSSVSAVIPAKDSLSLPVAEPIYFVLESGAVLSERVIKKIT